MYIILNCTKMYCFIKQSKYNHYFLYATIWMIGGPSNWEDNNKYSSYSESTDNDYMGDMDDETIPQFIPNSNDP